MGISTGIAQTRVPIIAIRMDPSRASSNPGEKPKILAFDQKIAAGVATANQPVLVTSDAESERLFGVGSMIDMICKAIRLNDEAGVSEIWGLPVEDASGGTAAAGSITITVTTAVAGTLRIYFGVDYVDVAVPAGTAQDTIAAALKAAIDAATHLPVTATVLANAVSVMFKHKGLQGNAFKMQANYFGASGGEVMPGGVTATIVQLMGGLVDPTLTTAISALSDDEYDAIVFGWNDASNLGTLVTELSRRWGYTVMVDSLAWAAMADAVGDLVTFGTTNLNSPHLTLAGYEEANITPPWVWAAAYAAAVHTSLVLDPARPCQTIELKGVLPTLRGSRFTYANRDSLLNAGIATATSTSTAAHIEREIMTYQKNDAGVADDSMLDIQTMATNRKLNREIVSFFGTKYPRCKLTDDPEDGDALPDNTMTPGLANTEIIGLYDDWAADGLVQDPETFAAALEVERDDDDPDRLNCLFPPELVGQFRVFAIVNQFRNR